MSASNRRSRGRLARGAAVVAAAVGSLVAAPLATATVPGRNGPIAFKRYLDADRTTGAIFAARPDGSHDRQVTQPASGTIDDQPDWSPRGSSIAFRRCAPDEPCAIYTVRADGSGERRLTAPCVGAPELCVDESEVAYMPDGRHVVFTRAMGTVQEFPNGEGFIEHSDIVIRDLAGEHTRVVVRSDPFSGDNVQAVAAPDGRRLAFRRQNSPLVEPADGIAIFVVHTDGTHLRRITPWELRAGDHPDWSPDGRWILFRSNEDGGFLDSQLYVVHPDGSGLRQVTHVSADTMLLSASFSPDGRRITVAMSGVDDNPDVYTMRVDGSDVRPVTRTSAWDSAPDWGPALRHHHHHRR